MSQKGLLIDYEFCTGCHSCEMACKVEHGFKEGEWGIHLICNGPTELEPGKWEYDYIPVPTQRCDLCADRVAEGRLPTCVHHCQALVMTYGEAEELAKRINKPQMVLFVPKASANVDNAVKRTVTIHTSVATPAASAPKSVAAEEKAPAIEAATPEEIAAVKEKFAETLALETTEAAYVYEGKLYYRYASHGDNTEGCWPEITYLLAHEDEEDEIIPLGHYAKVEKAGTKIK